MVARRDAEGTFVASMNTLTYCLDAYGKLEEQCSEKSSLAGELASIYFERGGLRKLIGAVLKFRNDHATADSIYLKPAAQDMIATIRLVQDLGSPTMEVIQLRAAFDGMVIAEILADRELLTAFQRVIGLHRASRKHTDEIRRLDAAFAEEPLLASTRKVRSRHSFRNADDETIKHYADSIMKATGYPEIRRRHVEDDIRKVARFDAVREEFCRHLEPVQNLIHTHFPETSYAQPTVYTCKCNLLGHETRIEYPDVDAVIAAMKSAYCSGCDKRSPLAE
jgi:hypothetical protein